MMKIQLRNLETKETLNFEFSDESTLHDLRLKINESTNSSSVRLSINRHDELLAVSSQATLRSLGVKSGDLIYYSFNSSDCSAFFQKSEAVKSGSIPRSQNQASDGTNHRGEELGGMNLMETLESDNEEDALSVHREVLVWWRMIKDRIVMPLLVNLCYKTGLELPPCFMRLPRELKHKILASLPGVDIATLACVTPELRDLASENDLWKQKCLEECQHLVTEGNGVVNWKETFASCY